MSTLNSTFNPQGPVAIIGAMPQEVVRLVEQLEDASELEVAGAHFHSGRLHGIDVVVLQSGIGKVNVTVSTTILIERFAPRCIINTGSAGGFGDHMQIGDVVISSEVRHHDVDVTAFGYEMGQVPGMPAAYLPNPALVSIARDSIQSLGGLNVHEGLICTGDSFMSDPMRVQHVREYFPSMLAVEMEAAAIAQACHLYGCPFVIIRALSDIAGQHSELSFDQFIIQAGEHSARMVAEMVKRLG
ncbi:5'-methylthioadenosine/S-adenosylhomocysteine nucleosidase [Zymobacter sp. IVIA_12111.31 C1]|uniref:5'-methylthioadenosine/S-adenosylhomocysteine nucleosidase n=1 Tax=Zymobacter sp. IVIA_12111.31 C1 TaxID=3394854 RepID=UPI0039C0BAEC